MRVKVSEASGPALDLMVAKCKGWEQGKYMMSPDIRKDANGKVIGIMVPNNREYVWFSPSTDWARGGPIIEREGIDLVHYAQGDWGADSDGDASVSRIEFGPTPLVAAMRCYVASKLGDEVEVPDGL